MNFIYFLLYYLLTNDYHKKKKKTNKNFFFSDFSVFSFQYIYLRLSNNLKHNMHLSYYNQQNKKKCQSIIIIYTINTPKYLFLSLIIYFAS